MKILFISDIHGVTNNLSYIKELDNKSHFDKIVVLGDLYYAGPTYNREFEIDSLKVKDFLMSYQDRIIGLKGNCDSDVDIKATDFPICDNLALIHTDDLDLYCTHGDTYSMSKNRKFVGKHGVLIYGHEHIPYIKQEDDMTYVCVGSISVPKMGKPTYAIYEDKEITIYTIDNEVVDKIKLD